MNTKQKIMKLTEQEKEKYVDWYLQECCEQADELFHLLDNVNAKGMIHIIHTIKDVKYLKP